MPQERVGRELHDHDPEANPRSSKPRPGGARRVTSNQALQAKLRVGAADDALEHEAEQVASEVLARTAVDLEVAPTAAPKVARATDAALAATAPAHGLEGGDVHDDVARTIDGARGGGRALDDRTRTSMEGGFGADFCAVRIHTGSTADALNRSPNAKAFTTGSDIFFAAGAYQPGSASGRQLLAHELTHTLQQGGAVSRSAAVQRFRLGGKGKGKAEAKAPAPVKGKAPKAEDKPAVTYPLTANIRGEAVVLEKEEDRARATTIITTVKADYGITFSGDKARSGIKTSYSQAPKKVREAVEVGAWQMKELEAVYRALAHYAPILGAKRKSSARGKDSQEVQYIGKVKQAIDTNSSTGVLDDTTMGEYFSKSKALGLFDAGTDSTEDFSDNLKQLEATAVHEMAHGLFGHEVAGWAKEFEFWEDRKTESGKAGAEAPPTEYGETNADEDLCESVMFYFVEEQRLSASSPLRHAYVKKLVEAWKKEEKVKKGKAKK
ncbi:hypothetical protein BH20ACT2_BH20ACT2_03730 [soil metagenome]